VSHPSAPTDPATNRAGNTHLCFRVDDLQRAYDSLSARGGRNAIERYLDETRPTPGSEERTALESMLKADDSILQIVDVEPGVGVRIRDPLRGGTGFLVDIGLGTTAPKGMVLATRVVPDPEGRFLCIDEMSPLTRHVKWSIPGARSWPTSRSPACSWVAGAGAEQPGGEREPRDQGTLQQR
jgi:hypothetical protein